MKVVAWRGAGGRWSMWHFEREEFPYSSAFYCRATLPTNAVTMRKKLEGIVMEKVCKECRENLYLENLKNEHHNTTG